MARILLLLVVVFLVWLAMRIVATGRRQDEPRARDATPSDSKTVVPVAQCAWCGVHAPAGTAVSLPDGRVYCGIAHRDAARAASTPPEPS